MTLRCWPPLCFPKARVGIVSLRLTSSSAILEPGGGKGPLWGLCLDFRALFLVSRVFAKFVSYTIWDLLLFATFPLQVFEFFFFDAELVDVESCGRRIMYPVGQRKLPSIRNHVDPSLRTTLRPSFPISFLENGNCVVLVISKDYQGIIVTIHCPRVQFSHTVLVDCRKC